MILFQILAANALLLHSGTAQIFPFSNLRAFFDPKTKQPRDDDQTNTNVSRPHRQADHDNQEILPSLQDFSSPDIYMINRDFGGHNYRTFQPTNTYYTSTEATRGTTKRRNSSRYRSRPDQYPDIEIIKSEDQVYTRPDHVFITPRTPASDQNHEESVAFSNVNSKARTRPTPRVPDFQIPEVTFDLENDEEEFNPPFSQNHPISVKTVEVTLPPDGLNSAENIPPLAASDEQTQSGEDPGLVDYLVPPKLPSVYEKTRKRPKLRSPTPFPTSKLKQRPPTPGFKKDSRFRANKKHRNDVKSKVPLAERATTAKRHTTRRRPNFRRDPLPRKPPTLEKTHLRQLDLQKQASQMDEQITAETGFSGASSHSHPPHGNERVEFQMHGQKGPHSYKFGYDTGKGHNRQFRYEEKDNQGRVRGHYGYYDKEGKLQVVNYEADPHSGFKAESV